MLMQVVRPEWLVGIEPRGAAQLRGLLDDVAASLDACAGRVQRLLDESGVACTVPQEIRKVGRTCVGTAEDLARRTRLVEGGGAIGPFGTGLSLRGPAPDLGLTVVGCGVAPQPLVVMS